MLIAELTNENKQGAGCAPPLTVRAHYVSLQLKQEQGNKKIIFCSML